MSDLRHILPIAYDSSSSPGLVGASPSDSTASDLSGAPKKAHHRKKTPSERCGLVQECLCKKFENPAQAQALANLIVEGINSKDLSERLSYLKLLLERTWPKASTPIRHEAQDEAGNVIDKYGKEMREPITGLRIELVGMKRDGTHAL